MRRAITWQGIKSNRFQILRLTKNASLIRIGQKLATDEVLALALANCTSFEIEKIDDHLFKTRQR